MNPLFSAIIHAVMRKRLTCSHCGLTAHHRRIGHDRYWCNGCNKESSANPLNGEEYNGL